MVHVGAVESANVPVIVLAAVTAAPVTGLSVPDTYPPLQVTEYPVDGVAVAFTVSPYFTVSSAAAVLAVTLLFACVTVSAFTVPLVGLLTVTLYVSLVHHI